MASINHEIVGQEAHASRGNNDHRVLNQPQHVVVRNPMVRWCHQRWAKDQNILMGIWGATGSGKSNTAQVIAKNIDPAFTEDQIVYDMHGFVNGMNTLGKYRVIILDEAAYFADARKFQSEMNNMAKYLLQTQRSLNQCYIFCIPGNLSFIDKSIRILFHITGNTPNTGLFNPVIHDIDMNGQLVYKRFYDWRGKPIRFFKIPKADAAIWKAYLKKKDAFNQGLRNTIQERYASILESTQGTPQQPTKPEPKPEPDPEDFDEYEEAEAEFKRITGMSSKEFDKRLALVKHG